MSEESPGASPPAEVSYRHEAIADEMLANPYKNQGDIAATLGFTQSWLSTVVNSSTFQAYYERRRREYNSSLADTAQRRSLEVGIAALDKVEEGLKEGEVDPVEAFDKALNRAGLAPSKGSGAAGGGGDQVQNNYYMAPSPEELATARQRMNPHVQEEGTAEIEHTSSGEG